MDVVVGSEALSHGKDNAQIVPLMLDVAVATPLELTTLAQWGQRAG